MGHTRSAESLNYYEHHLGDYLRDTAHLSLIEDAIYRRLLDQYYIRERPLPADESECAKLARAGDERQAVVYVLTSFFELQPDGWHQPRADVEIAKFRDKSGKARNSANARWNAEPKDSERNANAMRTHSDGNALQTPDTTKSKRASAPASRKCPPEFEPDADFARAECPDMDVPREISKFRDWEFKTARKDWPATWRTWVRNCRDRGQYAKGSSKALPPGVTKWL
jgi:uncharacterized protein YdaU (DUF1376 family)